MSTFEVTPGDLQSLASQLSGLLGELEQAAANISSGASGSAQNAQLEGAIDGFLADWSQSVQSLRTKLTEVAGRLGSAGSHYESTESELASHFGGA
ncbi:MAG TPA: type VII secretion target [Solirubrobacteraceae bacterium]|nr:type VII secretion target [Solirubrobacteraceae bacterium]